MRSGRGQITKVLLLAARINRKYRLPYSAPPIRRGEKHDEIEGLHYGRCAVGADEGAAPEVE